MLNIDSPESLSTKKHALIINARKGVGVPLNEPHTLVISVYLIHPKYKIPASIWNVRFQGQSSRKSPTSLMAACSRGC
jgi:hypothetical protein